jgi:hypothetical protein
MVDDEFEVHVVLQVGINADKDEGEPFGRADCLLDGIIGIALKAVIADGDESAAVRLGVKSHSTRVGTP